MSERDDLINALSRDYAAMHSAGDLRNRLAGDPSIPPPTPYENVMEQARGLHSNLTHADPVEMAMGLLGPRFRIPNPMRATAAVPAPATQAPSWRTQADALGVRAAERAGATEAEVPAQAAYMFGDQLFTGPHHFAAQDKAYSMLGDEMAGRLLSSGKVKEGFVTNRDGRFVTRDEASQLLGDKLQGGSGYTSEEAWNRLLGPNARVPGAASLVQRLAEVPKPPMRDALSSDFSLREYAPSRRGGNVYWEIEPPASLGRPNLPMGGIQARVDPAAKAVHIEGSNLLGDLRGRGIGTEMYQRLMDEAHKLGYKVHSDNNVSADAQKIYEALAQRGYGVERNPDATLNRAGELWVKDSYAPVFTVHPPEYASPAIAEIMKKKYGLTGAALPGLSLLGRSTDGEPQQ